MVEPIEARRGGLLPLLRCATCGGNLEVSYEEAGRKEVQVACLLCSKRPDNLNFDLLALPCPAGKHPMSGRNVEQTRTGWACAPCASPFGPPRPVRRGRPRNADRYG